MPFGFGKRQCPGESFALHSLFIFYVMLLQKVKIGKGTGKPLPDPKNSIAEMTHIPKAFHVSIKEHFFGSSNSKITHNVI